MLNLIIDTIGPFGAAIVLKWENQTKPVASQREKNLLYAIMQDK